MKWSFLTKTPTCALYDVCPQGVLRHRAGFGPAQRSYSSAALDSRTLPALGPLRRHTCSNLAAKSCVFRGELHPPCAAAPPARGLHGSGIPGSCASAASHGCPLFVMTDGALVTTPRRLTRVAWRSAAWRCARTVLACPGPPRRSTTSAQTLLQTLLQTLNLIRQTPTSGRLCLRVCVCASCLKPP